MQISSVTLTSLKKKRGRKLILPLPLPIIIRDLGDLIRKQRATLRTIETFQSGLGPFGVGAPSLKGIRQTITSLEGLRKVLIEYQKLNG